MPDDPQTIKTSPGSAMTAMTIGIKDVARFAAGVAGELTIRSTLVSASSSAAQIGPPAPDTCEAPAGPRRGLPSGPRPLAAVGDHADQMVALTYRHEAGILWHKA